MPAEIITLQFKPDLAGIQQAENHLQALAARFQIALSSAYAGAAASNANFNGPTPGGGGGGGGGGGAGGGGANGSPNPGGRGIRAGWGTVDDLQSSSSVQSPSLRGQFGQAIASGAGAGVSGANTALVGSPTALGVAAGLGGLQGAAGLVAQKVPVIGDFLALGVRAIGEAAKAPAESAAAEVAGIVGQMSYYGFSVSDEDIKTFAQERGIAHRRRYKDYQRAYRVAYPEALGEPLQAASFSLSVLGL